MTLSTVKWSLEDYHQMIKTGLLDDRPVELLSGEIVQMSPEGEPHAFFSSEAGYYLTRVLGDRALIRHLDTRATETDHKDTKTQRKAVKLSLKG
ncbi:MAG: hypothetical protein WAN66_26200 [Limnoraphis robusta]